MYRQFVDSENITEPLVLLCVLTACGAGPVIATPNEHTNHWSINTPDDVPFPYLIIDSLGRQGYVSSAFVACLRSTAPHHALSSPRCRYDLECLYDSLLNLLLKLPIHKAAQPLLAMTSLSSCLFLFRELLCLHPVPDPGFILCTIPTLSVIMNSFPAPLGDLAAHVLDMVTREALSPGWNFRQ